MAVRMAMQSIKKALDPIAAAKTAGLRYVSDASRGIRRERRGRGFVYVDAEKKKVTSADTLQRIRGLVIPPAWVGVWICPFENGHIQATGRDAKGRKQYIYHPRWREVRDETKYEKMISFARALPKVRAAVERDLKLQGLPREKVIATVIRLMEMTHIRIGNEEYARKNESFGLTTMRVRHVDVEGSKVSFRFRGKSGIDHEIDIRDRRIARIIRQCSDLPGHELFQYIDEEGVRRVVESNDVNEYLHTIAGEAFTAKDFRTWAGTVLAARALLELEAFTSATQAKKNVMSAIKAVAKRLGNTPSVCRKCYVHPAILGAYNDGILVESLKVSDDPSSEREVGELLADEWAIVALLKRQVARESDKGRLAAQLRESVARARAA